MPEQANRKIELEGIYNLRDLGGYPTPAGITKWHRFFRADSPHLLTAEAQKELTDKGLSLVIDLRSSYEVTKKPNPFADNKLVNYRHISLFSDGILGFNSTETPLVEMYKMALSERQEEFKEIFLSMAQNQGAVLYHCSAGKDRTGLVSILLLRLADVNDELIIKDYALTEEYIKPLFSMFFKDMEDKGVDSETFRPLLACKPEFIETTLRYIEATYGGCEQYLIKIGLNSEVLAKLRAKLLS